MNSEKIAEFITELRKQKGMTQKELAQKLNITDKAVSKWERGQSYPDITILPQLSELFGVSINELLNGERDTASVATQMKPQPKEPSAPAAQPQLKKPIISKVRRLDIGRILLYVLTASLFLGTLVSMICNLAITHRFTWSLYVAYSSVLTWCITAPVLLKRCKGILPSLIILTLLVFPYLWLIQGLTGANWFYPIGVLSALGGLVYIWIVAILWLFTRINRWYVGAISMFLCIALDLYINFVISRALGSAAYNPLNPISLLCYIALGTGFALTGALRRKKA